MTQREKKKFWQKRAKALFYASFVGQISDPYREYAYIDTLCSAENDEEIRNSMWSCMELLRQYVFFEKMREHGWYSDTVDGRIVWYHIKN